MKFALIIRGFSQPFESPDFPNTEENKGYLLDLFDAHKHGNYNGFGFWEEFEDMKISISPDLMRESVMVLVGV
jgi:hypothetical protein